MTPTATLPSPRVWASFHDKSGSAYAVRDATPEDLTHVYDMIYELAVYDRSEDQVKLTLEKFQEDSGLQPGGSLRKFECIVTTRERTPETSSTGTAESTSASKPLSDEIVAFGLYFYSYSTWEGRALYLEDVFVQDRCRGSGLGTVMMQALARIAVEGDCQRFQWQCLDWNKKSLEFYYEKLGAHERVEDDGARWCNVIMKRERMEELAARAKVDEI